ncbi:MAG TPA: Uma2 family endonuclease, partial [Blastocatellia bacterium]
MSTTPQPSADNPIILHFAPLLDKISSEDWLTFFSLKPEWHIELASEGDLIIRPLADGTHAMHNFRLAGIFGLWVKADGAGVGFGASVVFTLPNGAKRSPDLSWVKLARWQALSADERRGF